MDDKDLHAAASGDRDGESPEPSPDGSDATETIDVESLLTQDITPSGSFDIRDGIWATTFGKVIQALPIPVLLVNAGYDTVVANQACGKISPEYEKILEREFASLFPDPPTADAAQRILEQVFRTRVSSTLEGMLCIGAHWIWARTSFRSIRVGPDRYVLVLVEDLTAEKRQVTQEKKHNRLLRDEISRREEAEAALRKSETKYRELAELLPLIVFETDRTGAFTFVNYNAVGCLGYTRDEFYETLNLGQLVAPQVRETAPEDFLKKVASQQQRGYKCSMFREDGTTLTGEIHAAEIIHDNRFMGLRGVVLDVTERKKSEEALRESEQRFRTLVETMNDGLAAVDENGSVTYVNQRYADLLGYSREEIISGAETGFPVPESRDVLERQLAERREGRSGTYETVLTGKDGRRVPVLVSGNPMYDGEGRFRGSFGVFTDISRIKAAEERIRADLEEREVMLREIHHRVKNNLQVMSSLVELQSYYCEGKTTEEVVVDLIGRIRAMGLVHEHLHGSATVNRIVVHDYIHTVGESVLECYSLIPGSVDLRIDVAPEASWTIDTAAPCGLILNELIANSLKHAFPGGRSGVIEVSVCITEDNGYVLTVRDNGVGIPDAIDVSNPHTFGLEIVKILVDQICGTIDMSSSFGTEFSIQFKEGRSSNKA